MLHSDALPGDTQHEREADAFAAEFLTPRDSIIPELPTRIDLAAFAELQRTWGASIQSLIYRCREVGLFSDTTATRAYQRLNAAKPQPEPVEGFPGEQPTLLRKAFDLASDHGLSIAELTEELHWPPPRLRLILGMEDRRPTLDVIRGGRHDTAAESRPQPSARRLAVASPQDGATRN